MTLEIKLGNPIILEDARDLEAHFLVADQKGMANQLINADGQDLILFMPNDREKMYYLDAARFVLDVEALKALEASHGD